MHAPARDLDASPGGLGLPDPHPTNPRPDAHRRSPHPGPTVDPFFASQGGGGEPRTAGYWLVWNSCAEDNNAAVAAANGGREAGWLIIDDLLDDPGIWLGDLVIYYQIDHITFCWTYVDENGDEVCYQEETAWAAGDPYNTDDTGQWATYVTCDPEGLSAEIYAGQNMLAGTATFSAPVDGEVTIEISLFEGFVFYYDPADTEFDENLKVQDYAVAPEGNPVIGLFDWKESVEPGSTTATINVPVNNYYGVHLDVAYPDDCP